MTTLRRTPILRTTLPATLRALARAHALDLSALLRAAITTELRARGVEVPDEPPPRRGRPPGATRSSSSRAT